MGLSSVGFYKVCKTDYRSIYEWCNGTEKEAISIAI